MILLLLARAAAFSPWARNDTNAYVFKEHVNGVLAKRRQRLDKWRRTSVDALIRDAVGRGLHWNALGVAFPRDARDEVFAKFAQTVVAPQPVDRAMLRHDAGRLGATGEDARHSERRHPATVDADRIFTIGDDAKNSRRCLAAQDAGRLDASYYSGEAAGRGGKRTRHAWSFKLSDTEARGVASTRAAVSRQSAQDDPSLIRQFDKQPAVVAKPCRPQVKPRDDGAGTTLKFWAWALADFDGVVVADADVCWNGAFAGPYGRGSHRPAARFHFTSANELEGFAAELLRRRVPFAAAAERGNRDYDGFNSHFFWVRPSLDVFALLRDMAASGDFVPYTNTEQDVFDTVFSPHRHSFEALGIKPPTHEHTKGRCAGNDEPSSPTHAATGEFAECYARRYPDLYDAFCRHPSGCDINALGHHYRDRGASGGRIFRCGGCDACNYTVSEEGRTEWAACAR